MSPELTSSDESASVDHSDSLHGLVVLLDQAESRERRHLAEALHDEPLQLVVAAVLRIDNLRGEENDSAVPVDAADLADLVRILETAVEQLRNVIVTLSPPDLHAGLGFALRLLTESTFIGIRTRAHFSGPDRVRLNDDDAGCVYRVVREALFNARKHARASEVAVTLEEVADTIVVRVSDNGIGIGAPVDVPGHLGLASMRARAAAADATLTFISAPNEGTVVELVINLESADSGR